MILFKKIKNAYIYLFAFLLISLVIIFFTPIGIRNYAPIIFGLGCFPMLGVNLFGYLEKFSAELKEKEPEIFKKNEVYYGYFKGEHILIQSLYDSIDFKKIKNEKLYDLYLKTKTSINLLIISFLLIALLAIILIETKPII